MGLVRAYPEGELLDVREVVCAVEQSKGQAFRNEIKGLSGLGISGENHCTAVWRVDVWCLYSQLNIGADQNLKCDHVNLPQEQMKNSSTPKKRPHLPHLQCIKNSLNSM